MYKTIVVIYKNINNVHVYYITLRPTAYVFFCFDHFISYSDIHFYLLLLLNEI